MSTVTRRRIVRDNRVKRAEDRQRDHFALLGVDRHDCLGAPKGKRSYQGRIVVAGVTALIFGHSTKKRTKGRMCWFIVGAAA